MAHLPENVLLRADRFLLEIGGTLATEALRLKIAEGVRGLLHADSAEIENPVGAEGRRRPPRRSARLSAEIQAEGGARLTLAVRRRRAFDQAERALFDFVVPHIRQAWRNARAFSAARPAAPAARARVANLTSREQEVLRWMSAGKRNAEIATILEVSPRTVEKHLEHVFAKLGVETRTGAIREVLELAGGGLP